MEEERKAANFIEAEINKDIENHVYANDRVLTRFPPEPNGYLHIGHVKSICLNFGIGQKYHGETNVRFDDTNPAKEEVEYVNSILEDVKWLGFHWKEPVHYASDYFPQLYEFACKLIRMGLAYVDDQTSEEIHDTRGDLKHPGKESPYRNRSAEDAHDLSLEIGLQLITEGLHLCLFDNLHPPGRAAQNDPMAGVADLHRIHIRYRRQQHISSCLFSTDCDSLRHSFRIPCRRIKNDRYFLSHLDLLTGE